MNNTWIYDLEVFPNFFSNLMISSEDGEQEYVFIKYGDRDDVPAMLSFIDTLKNAGDFTLVGYNSLAYDQIVLGALEAKPEITNKQIYNVSQAIINSKNIYDLPEGLKEIAKVAQEPGYGVIDLLKLLQVNLNSPSLKHCSIHLEHDWLQDLPLPFNLPIKDKDVDDIIRYNRNDVEILRKLYMLPDIQEALNMRIILGESYGVDLRSAGDSKIANVILESKFGVPEIKGTDRPVIYGKDLIPRTLNFITPEMQAVQDHIFSMVIYKEDANFSHTFTFNNVEFIIGLGGLHSNDSPRKIVPKDNEILRDADVASYYPSLILKYELVPEHLDKKHFLKVYKNIVDERLEAKRTGDYIKNSALKITINSIFGKMGFEFFWLYDRLQFYRVTLYGQLLLLDLIEKLYLSGINCISANTDGIVCRQNKNQEDTYNTICQEWQTRTGMELEFTNYAKFVELNVNSYWTITDSGKIKVKKDFDENKDLKKSSFVRGYNAPIISMALQAYYKDGIEPEKFIKEYPNIHCFFYTQRAGQKFTLYYRTGNKEEQLQKTNRYFVAKSGGSLFKRDNNTTKSTGVIKGSFRTTREMNILKNKYVRIMNNIEPEKVIDNMKVIDYDYYIFKVREIIEKIEPVQKAKMVSIFD